MSSDDEMKAEPGRFDMAFTASTTIHTKLPADHPFYALVGRIASEWSQLEHILDETIWNLLGAERTRSACVTSQLMGVGPRCNVIDTLCRVRGIRDEFRKPFKKLKSDSFPVADWRNRFVHDAWLIEITSGKPAQFRAMPVVDPRYGPQEISEEQINRTLSEIHQLQGRAAEAHLALLGQL